MASNSLESCTAELWPTGLGSDSLEQLNLHPFATIVHPALIFAVLLVAALGYVFILKKRFSKNAAIAFGTMGVVSIYLLIFHLYHFLSSGKDYCHDLFMVDFYIPRIFLAFLITIFATNLFSMRFYNTRIASLVLVALTVMANILIVTWGTAVSGLSG